jgi:uncharacterized membrane protein
MNKFSTFVNSAVLIPILVVNKLLMERFIRRLAQESFVSLPHAIVTLDLLIAEQDMTNCLNFNSSSESFA